MVDWVDLHCICHVKHVSVFSRVFWGDKESPMEGGESQLVSVGWQRELVSMIERQENTRLVRCLHIGCLFYCGFSAFKRTGQNQIP